MESPEPAAQRTEQCSHRPETERPTSTAFLLGRQAVLVSLGLTFLAVEQIQAIFQQAVARGEVAESDAQQMPDALQRQLAEGTTSHISSRLAEQAQPIPATKQVKGSGAPNENSR